MAGHGSGDGVSDIEKRIAYLTSLELGRGNHPAPNNGLAEACQTLRPDQRAFERDLADAIEHLRRLNETPSINEDAEQRRQESITRTLNEIQRLMDG